LDRQKIQDILLGFTRAQVHVSPTAIPRDAHLVVLSRLAGSDLEREWLEWMDQHGYRLPDAAQVLIEGCGTRPDFVYEHDYAVIYVDGPHHDYPERQERDRHQEMCLEDEGYTVIRFGYHDDWATTITRYPHIFGGEA